MIQTFCCNRRTFLKSAGAGALLGAVGLSHAAPPRKPNFIIIFTDDQGYQDVGCFGSPDIQTPHLDRMAAEGMRLTDFYVASPVCTPSRAALMTGCYPQRVGLPSVLGPKSNLGLSDKELTIADLVKTQGYATACYGKWHLGHHPEFLPMRHGFDDYFGLPYSNDMWPNHPTNKKYPPLPLIEGEKVIEENPDQTQLTTWYTERAVRFIKEHRDQPFFLYLPHSMVHVPLFVSDKFKGKSKQGLYGDCMMEIDWSVGQVLSTLKDTGIDEHTLVVFTSDNGPWLSYGAHAGNALPLREGKATTFDGGQRVPCIVRWPKKVPQGQECHEVCVAFDLLPTIAELAGATVPDDRVIDGKDIWPLLSGQEGATSPHEAFFYLRGNELQAVRSGHWKLHVPHKYKKLMEPGSGGMPGIYANTPIELALFDLKKDLGEEHNVASEHPEVVKRLQQLTRNFQRELKANKRRPGKHRKKN